MLSLCQPLHLHWVMLWMLMPIELREGSFLLAVPKDIASDSAQTIAEGHAGSEEVLFVPNSTFVVKLVGRD